MSYLQISLFGLFLSIIGPNIVLAADQLYPAGSANSADYSISPASPAGGETFVITRTLINSESFPLSSVYLGDNLPPDFTIDSVLVTINGIDQVTQQEGPISGQVVTGYQSYRWIIGDLAVGDSLVVKIYCVCSNPSSYTLPLHNTIMYGNSSAYFATADPVSLLISPPQDITSPAQIVDLQESP